MKVYPLKLKPVLKGAIWGGKSIPELFGIGEKGESIAEAWSLKEQNILFPKETATFYR